jgi:tRNA(adenine34) deaminase
MERSIDESFMRRCIALAERARLAGETGVGALIVCGGVVLAEASEQTRADHDPGAHAEILAVRAAWRRRASADLSDCTLYTTVEPCVFCSYLIRKTRIARVVYGIPADQIGGVTSRYAILTDSSLAGWSRPPEITAGVLADECQAARRGLGH